VSEAKPAPLPPEPLVLDLEWLGDHRLRGRSGGVEMVMDSPPVAGPSPVQALAFGLAGCMAIDVLVVMKRGRFDLKGLKARLVAERATTDPRRILRVNLHYTVAGVVPADRVERAIELSREKYCSVWHSMARHQLTTSSLAVRPGTGLLPTAPAWYQAIIVAAFPDRRGSRKEGRSSPEPEEPPDGGRGRAQRRLVERARARRRPDPGLPARARAAWGSRPASVGHRLAEAAAAAAGAARQPPRRPVRARSRGKIGRDADEVERPQLILASCRVR
jgi:putative redox protein